MKRIINLITLLSLLIISFGCGASVKPTVYESQKIKEIKMWKIDFKYEPGEIERKIENDVNKEVKITTGGRTSRDLQLKDDINYFLKDNYEINLDKTGNLAEGKILLNPVYSYSGHFKSVDVSFEDNNGSTLARVRVQNGDRNLTIKDDYDFAEYVADAIAEIIKE